MKTFVLVGGPWLGVVLARSRPQAPCADTDHRAEVIPISPTARCRR